MVIWLSGSPIRSHICYSYQMTQSLSIYRTYKFIRLKSLSNGLNICLNICWVRVERCWDNAVSNGLTNLSKKCSTSDSAWGLGLRTMLRGVERACQTASTFREQKYCWDVQWDEGTKDRPCCISQTPHRPCFSVLGLYFPVDCISTGFVNADSQQDSTAGTWSRVKRIYNNIR